MADLCDCGHERGRHHSEFGCREDGCTCAGYTRPYTRGELAKLKQELLERGPASLSYPSVDQVRQLSESNLRWLYDNGAFPLGVSWRDLLLVRSGRR